jgi:hypothetical protein
MTQDRANGDGTPVTALPTDAELLQKWYEYASRQPGSIGSLLQLLRFRQRKSAEQQRLEFGVSAADFAKLQSIHAPRPDRFRSDAQRIAAACHVGQVFHFVQMLMLARNLAAVQEQTTEGEVYEAAFDALASEQDGTEE